jgi:hypothetical protein
MKRQHLTYLKRFFGEEGKIFIKALEVMRAIANIRRVVQQLQGRSFGCFTCESGT